MRRTASLFLVPVLFLTIAVTLLLSPATAQPQNDPDTCMADAGQAMATCMQKAADDTQRDQCRDYFECLRDACAAIRKGETPKACKPPF